MRDRRLIAWALPLVAGAAFFAALTWLHEHPSGMPAEPPPLLEAGFVQAPAAPPPGPEADWRTVALPHVWSLGDPAADHGWIRLRAEAVDGDSLALYLPQSSPVVEAWLGDHRLPGVERGPRGLDLGLPRPPRLIALPAAEVPAEGVSLRLRLEGPAHASYMGPAWIAPPDQLEAPYQLRTLVEVSAVRFVFLAGLAFSLFLFITWLADRSDRATLWMAVGFACLTAAGWSLATLGLPVPRPRTTWVGNGVMLAVVVSMTHRLLGISRPRLETAFWVFAALALLSRVVVPEGATSELVRRVMLGPALLGGLYPLAVVLHAHATRPSLETTCLITTGLVFQIAALHDLGWYASFTPASHTGSLHLAIGVSLAGFGWLFVQRFVRALRSEEAVSRSLDARVREKELELDENYRRLAVLERERVIQDERTRLMEDLHDGLGGRISSALAQVQSGGAPRETVASSLRDAMHEMRILLHSLDRENAALSTLLGALRDPLEPLLESAGIRLRWQVEDVPDPAGYGPEMALHVVRIVQQAAVNAAEHSKARELRIATTTRGTGDDARVVILVEDDGIGLPAAPASAVNGRHHGLRNMQRRAERIGAELELAPAHPGTKLELRLPIGASSSGPPPAGPGAA